MSFIEKSKFLIKKIDAEKETLFKILQDYESFETADDEISRSINCLSNISKEEKFLRDGKVEIISSFLPTNLPLYSLVLFGVVPSYISKNVYLRPPKVGMEVIKRIFKVLDSNVHFPNLMLSSLSRSLFVESYVPSSSVTLFSGSDKNVDSIKNLCGKKSLFIFNGPGINPIVVGKKADVEKSVEKTIKARVFNSGQDCAGPDSIFVHSSLLNKYLKRLSEEIAVLGIGKYSDRNVRVGRLLDEKKVLQLGGIFLKNREYIVYGGSVDFRNRIVEPTIFLSNIKKKKNYEEWFSPVFWISEFKNDIELGDYFDDITYNDFAMYVTVFGDVNFSFKNSILLKDKIILDIERGNTPYGGFGRRANFSFYTFNNEKIYNYRPILISKEIYDWKLNCGLQ